MDRKEKIMPFKIVTQPNKNNLTDSDQSRGFKLVGKPTTSSQGKETLRTAAIAPVRAAESVADIPFDILRAVNPWLTAPFRGASALLEYASGKPLPKDIQDLAQAVTPDLNKVLPGAGYARRYVTEPLTGDLLNERIPMQKSVAGWSEFAGKHLPMMGLTGGLSSIPGALMYGAGAAAMNLAGKGLSYLGEQTGLPAIAELAELPVTAIVGHKASKLAARAINAPSKIFPKAVSQKERAIFEEGKQQDIQKINADYLPHIEQAQSALTETQSALKKAQFEYKEAQKAVTENKSTPNVENLERAKEKLTDAKKNVSEAQKTLNTEVEHGKNLGERKKSQGEHYTEATETQNAQPAEVTSMVEPLNEIEKNSELALPAEDKGVIDSIVGSIRKAIENGTLTTKQAKTLFHNINAQTFKDVEVGKNQFAEKTARSKGFTDLAFEITDMLDNFIKENNTEEHNAAWDQANADTVALKNEYRGHKAYKSQRPLENKVATAEKGVRKAEQNVTKAEQAIKNQKNKIELEENKQAAKEKISQLETQAKEAAKNLEDLTNKQAKAIDQVNAKTFEDMLAKGQQPDELASSLTTKVDPQVYCYAACAVLGSGLVYLGFTANPILIAAGGILGPLLKRGAQELRLS